MSGHRFQPIKLPAGGFDGRPEWHEQASCRGAGPDLFFNPQRFDEARLMCVGCPVFDRCREQGQREMFGTWAASPASVKRRNGYTPRDPKPLEPCGSDAAYKRHLRRGETACAACREAHNRKVSATERARRRKRKAA